jgi:hypothetical protein
VKQRPGAENHVEAPSSGSGERGPWRLSRPWENQQMAGFLWEIPTVGYENMWKFMKNPQYVGFPNRSTPLYPTISNMFVSTGCSQLLDRRPETPRPKASSGPREQSLQLRRKPGPAPPKRRLESLQLGW